MSEEILVLCPDDPDWGLVSKAAGLARPYGREVHVLAFSGKEVLQAFVYGADKVDILYLPEDFADDHLLAEWIGVRVRKDWNVEIILAPATIRMRAVMPILAGLLGAGLTADCTELEILEDGRLLQIRPAFGNNLMAWINTVSGIQMATVRTGVFRESIYDRKPNAIEEHRISGIPAVRQTDFKEAVDVCPLHQADIIIAGGMGIGSKDDFQLLAEAARKAGAAVGASRKAVDAGYAPYSWQIGQTGVTVHPRLYIAVGISGAVQHLAGMSGAEKVIAINSDPKAPIFDYADYGIVGDWKETISLLMRTL